MPFNSIADLAIGNLYKTDARLTKTVPIGEKLKMSLMFEAFNVFNTPYDTGRRGAEYDFSGTTLRRRADYATPSSTAASPDGTTSRRAQLSLRLLF